MDVHVSVRINGVGLGHAYFFPWYGHLYLKPVSQDRRYHPRSDDLLHHQRATPSTSSAVYSSAIPVSASDPGGYRGRSWIYPERTGHSGLRHSIQRDQHDQLCRRLSQRHRPATEWLGRSKYQQIPGTYQWGHGSSFQRFLDYTGQHSGLHHQLHLPAFQRRR